MLEFNSQINFIVQALMLVIIIGVFYNFLASTKAYGGIVGKSIRLLGIGMLFISIGVIERVLVNFSVIGNSVNLALGQDILNILGLLFLAFGFSKLASAGKV